MLSTFSALKGTVSKIQAHNIIIDNIVFKLHYRLTFLALLVATVLVTSQQYIGEHIHCINDKGVPEHVMKTFCFFTTTFTVDLHWNFTELNRGAIPHPGVGPYVPGVDSVTHHAYYQWVPFVLFLQAIAFYIPHYIWKKQEGGSMKKFVEGLQLAALATSDTDVTISAGTIPSKRTKTNKLKQIQKAFLERIHINRMWSVRLVSCEVLNLIHLLFEIYVTNKFLGGKFLILGPTVCQQGLDTTIDILDIVFPKVTKCIFYKYGPSGSMQQFDSMCVMALNIVNEKIFVFLWFWYTILLSATILGLLWRLLTFFLHARSRWFNKVLFANSCPGKWNPFNVLTVTKRFHYSDWLYLYYLSKNMDGFVFYELFVSLAEEMEKGDADKGEHAQPLIPSTYPEKPQPLVPSAYPEKPQPLMPPTYPEQSQPQMPPTNPEKPEKID